MAEQTEGKNDNGSKLLSNLLKGDNASKILGLLIGTAAASTLILSGR